MTAIYQLLTDDQREFMRDWVRVEIKQDISTTGSLMIDSDDKRILSDNNASFESGGIEAGDTVEILYSTPVATTPASGFYTILDVIDENTIEIDGSSRPIGIGIKYRVTDTGGLQELINSFSRRISRLMNIDVSEALYLEGINYPWYNTVTEIVFQYFSERNGLDGYQFAYPIYQSDLDAVTISPAPLTLSPGPVLYPYGYGSTLPDKRYYTPASTATPGLGTPTLLGLPDTLPIAIPSYSYGTGPGGGGIGSPINVDTGELPSILEEENFYIGTASQWPTPGYKDDDVSRLTSIKNAIENALTQQASAISYLQTELSLQITDLQNRGLTGTPFYASISVARLRLNAAASLVNFHLTDSTYGVPAINLGSAPSANRRSYITSVRPSEVDTRVSQILSDQAHWVQSRYSFLSRRVNRSDGSLTLLRRAYSQLSDIQNIVDELLSQRVVINNVVGEGT